MATISSDVIHRIYKVQVQLPPGVAQNKSVELPKETIITKEAKRARTNEETQQKPVVNAKKQLGRNDPCPCGSGKKWKRCHYPKIP